MNELTTTRERVLDEARTSISVEKVLKGMFPTAFEPEFKLGNVYYSRYTGDNYLCAIKNDVTFLINLTDFCVLDIKTLRHGNGELNSWVAELQLIGSFSFAFEGR